MTSLPQDPPRKAISRRLRFEILKRDNHTCRYCGGQPPDVKLTIDHVVPVALGGGDDPSNLVAACRDCNSGKASTSPDAATVAQVSEDAIRWRAAMQQASAEMTQDLDAGAAYCEPIAHAWDTNNEYYRRGNARIPDNWTNQVEHWRSLGLPSDVVADAVCTAMCNKAVSVYDVWRYTAGICWNKVRRMQERAAEIVGGS